MRILTFLILGFASIVLADDFKTIEGKEYKNATVRRVEPDGIVLITASGISKVYFTELPKEVQERFHYDPLQARYTSLKQQEYKILQQIGQAEEAKKNEERINPKEKKRFSKMSSLAGQLPALHSFLNEVRLQKDDVTRQLRQAQQAHPQNTIQALQARYQELQQEENDLMLRIGEGEVGTYRGIPNSQRSQLPFLHNRLDDVHHEKDLVRQQLEQAQR